MGKNSILHHLLSGNRIEPSAPSGIFPMADRLLELGHHRHVVPVLEGPHAFRVEERHAVAIVETVRQIGLQTGHRAQIAVDERDPALFSGHRQMREQVLHGRSCGQLEVLQGEDVIIAATILR